MGMDKEIKKALVVKLFLSNKKFFQIVLSIPPTGMTMESYKHVLVGQAYKDLTLNPNDPRNAIVTYGQTSVRKSLLEAIEISDAYVSFGITSRAWDDVEDYFRSVLKEHKATNDVDYLFGSTYAVLIGDFTVHGKVIHASLDEARTACKRNILLRNTTSGGDGADYNICNIGNLYFKDTNFISVSAKCGIVRVADSHSMTEEEYRNETQME